MEKDDKRYFEDARQTGIRRAAPTPKKRDETLNISDGVHVITHPRCYDCGSLMILLNDGKFCPACGRLAVASDGWKATHLKYSGVA